MAIQTEDSAQFPEILSTIKVQPACTTGITPSRTRLEYASLPRFVPQIRHLALVR